MVKIIAFGHKARQGKSWASHFLARRLSGRTMVWGFGDGLKAHARAGFGMGVAKNPGLLQALGERLREEDPKVWLKVWEGAIEDQEGHLDWILVPDLRHQNEALYLKGLGATLVKVVRTTPEGTIYQDPSRDPLHRSEVDLDDFAEWDQVIVAANVASLAFALTESFLGERSQLRDRKTYHLRSGFALERG